MKRNATSTVKVFTNNSSPKPPKYSSGSASSALIKPSQAYKRLASSRAAIKAAAVVRP